MRRVCGVCAAFVALAAAAEPLSTSELTLADAVRIAHERNPDLLALRTAMSAAELDLEAARSVFRAQFASRFDSSERTGAEIGTVYEVGMSKLGESGSRWGFGLLSSQFGDRALSELRFSYRLPFFANPARDSVFAVDSAEIAFERQRRIAAIGTEELTTQVVSAYYGVVLAANEIVLMTGSNEVAQTLAQAVAVRAATGMSTDLDLRRARLHVAETYRAIRLAEMALERARLQLAAVLGVPPDTPLDVDDTVPDATFARDTDPLFLWAPDTLESRAVARRPELLALAAEIELLERKIEAYAPRLMPPVDVSLQLSLVGEGRGVGDTFSRYEPRIGLGFGMALDQGPRRDIDRRRLGLQYTAAVQSRAALEDRVRGEARDAALVLEERLSELAFRREASVLAEEEYRSIELRHRVGRTTTEEALDAAQRRAATRQRELDARVGYWVAKHRVDALAGAGPLAVAAAAPTTEWAGLD